jgi:DNA-binding transcriptional LysR family regulator
MVYKVNILIGESGIMRGSDYAELKAFVTVVANGNFARAAAELRISASTLSQTIRDLENRIGVRLLNRTTRSVSLTNAGARLHARFRPAMIEMEAAVQDVVNLRDSPSGTLRVHLSRIPAATFLEPILGRFHEAYPGIVLDVTVDEAVTDIVEAGYDVGIRLGEFLQADMVAVKIGGDQRQLVVASPSYIERHGKPDTPADLLRHRCINWRQPGSANCYKWEFLADGRWFSVAVNGPLIVSQRDMAVVAALQGVGIAFWAEERVRPLIDEGKLIPLLEEWCGIFPGWFLYYPKQRCTPLNVRAFVDFLRQPSFS